MKSWIRVAVVVVGLIALSFLLKATVFRPKPIEVEATPVARGVVEMGLHRAGPQKSPPASLLQHRDEDVPVPVHRPLSGRRAG